MPVCKRALVKEGVKRRSAEEYAPVKIESKTFFFFIGRF